MSHEIVSTRSGARAMRCQSTGEVMHPVVGPLVEAERLYVRQSRLAERLASAQSSNLVLFDVGLGAGSNALAARAVSERATLPSGWVSGGPPNIARLEIVSFERDLGAIELALGEPLSFGIDEEGAAAVKALLVERKHETPRTSWRLALGDLLESLAGEAQNGTRADIVFWDPFSPRANPLLWTVAAFNAVRQAAGPRATLFTYSASTAVRIAMLLGGWAVGVGDGIGDKRATTVAAVLASDLERPLDRDWLARLSRADVPLPLDAPGDAVERVRRAPQFAKG